MSGWYRTSPSRSPPPLKSLFLAFFFFPSSKIKISKMALNRRSFCARVLFSNSEFLVLSLMKFTIDARLMATSDHEWTHSCLIANCYPVTFSVCVDTWRIFRTNIERLADETDRIAYPTPEKVSFFTHTRSCGRTNWIGEHTWVSSIIRLKTWKESSSNVG